MKTRVFSLLLALTLLCGLLPQFTLPARAGDDLYSGSCGAEGDGSNLTWRFDPDTGTLTIEGSGAMQDFGGMGNSPWNKYSITTVSLPKGLTSIGEYAFCNCRSLKSVTIQEGVTSIGYYAFYGCVSLTSVTIPASVTSISVLAFDACRSLLAINVASKNSAFSSLNGVLFDKTQRKLIQYPAGKADTSYQIPEGVTRIGDYAFRGCRSLASVTIPDSVTDIGKMAFYDCRSLPSVTIPASVTSIGNWAFECCSSLTSVTIPDSVTSIGDWAFERCISLTSVTIPEGVTSIGKGTFKYCSSLTSVTIPEGVTSIGDHAFEDCNSLTSVTIPASVTGIGDKAFGWYENQSSLERMEGFTINSYNGTVARSYAEKNGFHVVSLGVHPFFADVKDSKFYYVPVLWAYYHKPRVTTGTSATQFSPNQPCTRGQVVSFLWRAYGEKPAWNGTNPFVDAKAGKYYYNAMLWALKNNVTVGTDATHFQPNAGCTRAQVVTFLWRAAGSPEPKSGKNPFADVKEGKFYYKAVLWAVEKGITAGTDATHFQPNASCTRGQVVTFLYRQQAQ